MYFQGGFTLQGLQTNITVGIMFINAWLRGKYIPDVHQGLLFDAILKIVEEKALGTRLVHQVFLSKATHTFIDLTTESLRVFASISRVNVVLPTTVRL